MASAKPVLILSVLCLVSAGVIAAVVSGTRHAWSHNQAALDDGTKVGRANVAWEKGERAEAVELYRFALDFEKNPMLGVPIPDADRPVVYARVIEGELPGNPRDAIRYARQAVDKGLADPVSARCEGEGRDLLLTVRDGYRLRELVAELAKTSPPDAQAPAESQAAYGDKVEELLTELGALAIDPARFPDWTRQLQDEVRSQLGRIRDAAVAARARAAFGLPGHSPVP